MSVVENNSVMDLLAAELVRLGEITGTSGLLDANGDWRDEAVQLVQLIEAYRDGKEMNSLIANDIRGFRRMEWEESTERGLKALYFAEEWNARRRMLTKGIPHQVPTIL